MYFYYYLEMDTSMHVWYHRVCVTGHMALPEWPVLPAQQHSRACPSKR